MNIQLVVIDGQKDFCNPPNDSSYQGTLYVDGADQDMKNLSTFIRDHAKRLDDIHLTFDSHNKIDVAHPLFWKNTNNEHPNPFTLITYDDISNGVWLPFHTGYTQRMLDYTKSLEDNGKYVLCIWPEHCIIGSIGHSLHDDLFDAVSYWEESEYAITNKVTKGSNILTEHYSAIQADVPDADDPSTQLNTKLLSTLHECDKLLIAGEALSHCVSHTVRDIADNFSQDEVKKFTILQDCSSSVTGFEQLGIDFLNDMKQRGVSVAQSTDVF